MGRERGFSDRAVSEAEELEKNPKRPMVYAVTESRLSREILSCCKGYCGWADVVLAGDQRELDYYVILI